MKEEVLDPISRTSEILFGLIMVLSFTCSFSVVNAGRSDVREMLLGALGCNIAWGVIDGFFYLLNMAAERGHERLELDKKPAGKLLLTFSDLKATFYIFSLVFLSTFPVALPFLLIHDPWSAVRFSNLVSLILLFSLGFSLGRYAGGRPVLWGTTMAVIGSLLVSITISLGG
jgi:hypothetical protein